MIRAVVAVGLLVLGALVGIGEAIDHTNLDEGRPLRVEDAYPIAHGEVSVETGAGFALLRHRPDRGAFPIEILYGALPNLQLGVGSVLFTDPHAIDDQPKSGDLRASALYNFNQETLVLPALGVRINITAPTGVGSAIWDIGLRGLVTKSFERLSLHFNGGYDFLPGRRVDERDGRYELIVGASYPIGAPGFTRATLIGDIFTEQSLRRGQSSTVGAEVGMRYQLTPRLVWDVGLGTEFAGPGDRASFLANTGLSFGF